MALFGPLGDFIQKALFNTSVSDVLESIDALRIRIEELDQKLEREVANLESQISEKRAQTEDEVKH